MGNTSGALGFVEGLMGGMERREEHDRNKRIDKMLDQKSQQNLLSDVGAYETHLNEGGDPDNWIFQQEQEDPFLLRQMKKIKNWATGAEPEAKVDPYAAAREQYAGGEEEQKTAIPQGPRFSGFADGGSVDEDEEKRRRNAAAMDAADIRGAYRPPALRKNDDKLDLGPAHEDPLLPRTRAVAGEVRRENEYYAPEEGDSAYTRGSKWMDRAQNNVRGFFGGAAAFGRDMVDLAVPDAAAEAVQGALGYTGHEDYEGKPQAVPTEEPKTAIPPGMEAPAAAAQESVGETGPSDAQVANTATQTAAAEIPGHPDGPDQQFNFGEMAREGWDAADIAHVPLKDWNEYRQNHVLASIKQGKSVTEANAEVDAIQQAGFIRNFRQASYLMMAGDEAGAALAARAAYQYFPNGTDVRFKQVVGKDGQDYLVAAGFDEETGEMRGEPQIMTPDYVNAMLANFEDPKAFNAWKADKEEAYRLERQYKEIDKPTAQADLDLKGAQTDYYRSGAQKNRADASGEQGAEPLTESNKIAAHDRFVEAMGTMQLENEAVADQLVSIMNRIYAQTGGEVGVIIDEVKKLYREAGQEGINALIAEWSPSAE